MRWSNIQSVLNREFLEEHYVARKLGTVAIAQLVGCGDSAVRSALKRAGIPARKTVFAHGHAGSKNALNPGARKAKDALTRALLIDRYENQGLSLEAISKETGCSRKAVSTYLRKFGIKTRESKFQSGHKTVAAAVPISPTWRGQTKATNPTVARIAASNKGKPRPSASGSNHHNWKGGKTDPLQRVRNSMTYAIWRESVLSRDNRTCQQCGAIERDKKLHAHHLESFTTSPDKRLSVSNGITLCAPCHSARHQVERG